MRLTLRFFALLLLLAIVAFPNSSSMTTMSDEDMVIEEGGNPCLEGCIREEQSCTDGCDTIRVASPNVKSSTGSVKPVANRWQTRTRSSRAR